MVKGKFDNTSKSLKILWNCLQLSKKVFKGFHRQPLYLPTQYLTGVLKILAQTTYCIVGHTYFPVNFAKVLRASFLQNTSERLLLTSVRIVFRLLILDVIGMLISAFSCIAQLDCGIFAYGMFSWSGLLWVCGPGRVFSGGWGGHAGLWGTRGLWYLLLLKFWPSIGGWSQSRSNYEVSLSSFNFLRS